jgi:hypothetical protein
VTLGPRWSRLDGDRPERREGGPAEREVHHGPGQGHAEPGEHEGDVSGRLQQVEESAARLGRWLGDVRFTPRLRTPLERELVT